MIDYDLVKLKLEYKRKKLFAYRFDDNEKNELEILRKKIINKTINQS